MKINIQQLLNNDRSLLLAADQGLEHGPALFTLDTVQPTALLDIALEGQFQGIILQSGVAEKYHHEAYRDIPLIVKLTGKTPAFGSSQNQQLCSVDRAIKLGAAAVDFTLFDGTTFHHHLPEFTRVIEQAHDYGIPVLASLSSSTTQNQTPISPSTLAQLTRTSLELGADFAQINTSPDLAGFQWAMHNAGRQRVLVADSTLSSPQAVLAQTKELLSTGITGRTLGQEFWQQKNPLALAHALQEILFRNKNVEDVLHYLDE